MKKLITQLLLLPIRFYQYSISPLFPSSCRFTPTCSQYAIDAIKKHGPERFVFGDKAYFALSSVGGSGYDPVP